MSETKDLNPEVLALSEKMRKDIFIDSDGKPSVEKTIFEKNLPDGLDYDTVKQVRQYSTNFVAAGAHASGMAAIDAMVGNKKIDQVVVELPMCEKDRVTYSVDRKKTIIDHLHDKQEITKYGQVGVTLEVHGAKNAGQLKIARNLIGTLAMEKLAK
jgi:hypothetical protein